MINKKLNIIDLFAGCGGLSDGFEQTKLYNTVACVEWEKAPCNTLVKRLQTKWGYKNAQNIVLRYDIQNTDKLINGWDNDSKYGSHEGLNSLAKNVDGNIDAIIGGPPCQAYSIAGRIRDENKMNDDYRNFLFESYLKVVDHFKPKVFVFENVPGLFSANPGGVSIINRILESFNSIGYSLSLSLKTDGIIDCTKFGIPQARKRVIIIGINNRLIKTNPQDALSDFYNNILPAYNSDIRTVKDALEGLPKLYPLKVVEKYNGRKFSHMYKNCEFLNNSPRMHNERDISIFKLLTEDIETNQNKYLTVDALKQLYYNITGKKSNIHKYHVLRWDKPSNTIPAHLYKDGLRHIHPDSKQSRTITVREAARLQTFADDFEFIGSLTDQYKMVGNAVPPKLAKVIALSVAQLLKTHF